MKSQAIFRPLRFCVVACLSLLSLAASEHHGIVKFGSVPIPGATVTATKGDKKATAVTDESGIYSFPDLEDGVWSLKVEMLTFAPLTKDIGVVSGAPGAEWELKMMSMDEIKPSVQAQAPPSTPATPAPTTASSTPSTAANPQQGGTPKIAAAAPPAANAKGKKGAAPTSPQPGFQRADVNASGGGDSAPAGGATSAAAPSIAEAQSSADAFVVNGSTSNGIERRAIGNGRKGPRSLFTGGLDFRQFGNDHLDARSYSITGQDTPRSPYNHFTLGAQVQGPLWMPHVFRWTGNFFVQYQTTRLRNAQNTAYTMPTAAERNGDFAGVTDRSGNPVVLKDPATGQPIPNNLIPANQISPQAKYFLQYYPLPQFAADASGYNFEEPVVTKSVQDQFSARVNKPINNKSSLNFLYAMQLNANDNYNVLSWVDNTKVTAYHGNVAYNRNFTRTFIGRFTVDYTRYSVRTIPFFANKTNVSGDAGIIGNDQNPNNWGPPSLGFGSSGIYGLSDGNDNFIRNQTPAFGGQITYIRRPHNFQFGGDFKTVDQSVVGQSNGRGSFGFDGSRSGFDFADFLFGAPNTSGIALGNADKYLHSNIYDLYINDNWNVNSSLTFQWGVRWDYASPFTEKYGRLANLDVTTGWANSAAVTALNPLGPLTGSRYPDSLFHPDKHQFSPRLSFAWRPIFGSSMVVRGGYGIYYNTSIYPGIAAAMYQQAPFSKSFALTNTVATPLSLATGFGGINTSADTFAVDPNLQIGYSHQYYVSVQQNVTASLLLTAQYSGVKGAHTLQEFDPNTAAPGGTAGCTFCYTYLTSNGNAIRNQGQLSLRRRFHGGLSTNFTYTYAKAIDDSGSLLSYGGGAAAGGPGPLPMAPAQNWLNLAGERGPSTTDQRHLLTLNMQYSTGVGVHGGALLSGWRGVILKGWTFLSTITIGSGMPFTPLYALPLAGKGDMVVRPNYVSGQDVYGGAGGLFLNPNAFAQPATGQFGTFGRDALYGPNQFSMIGSMARSFQDKYTLTVAATNIPNHPSYTGVYSTFGTSSKFGQFLPPGGMRTLSATFRWTF